MNRYTFHPRFSLARWWAEKLGDEAQDMSTGNTYFIAEGRVYKQDIKYLDDMNTARRAREWATEHAANLGVQIEPPEEGYEAEGDVVHAIFMFESSVWDNAPQALHDLAIACGWEGSERP